MKLKNNDQQYTNLREEYPFFEYQSYSFKLKNGSIEIEFSFNLSDIYMFKPVLNIPIRDYFNRGAIDKNQLDNFIFHIGMVELISYWKVACPPKVIIRPHFLDEKQIAWWKKLYYHGLGEFFYLNGITAYEDTFMTIFSEGNSQELSTISLDTSKVIVPIGGGKDSVVTLELLTRANISIIPMIVNPRDASIKTLEIAGYNLNQSIVVNRYIDDNLLSLNKLEFLNGHTPFSALLAFTGALCSALSGIANIALSNESSANESTIPGTKINHQYSKTYEFENDFSWYLKKYIHPEIKYFSFLRPVNELQIASLFARFPQHFYSFKSCNVGSKTNIWCGKCSKCLFTYIILSPFIKHDILINIFGKDMLDDIRLKEIFEKLTGISNVKPFECVGTPNEVNAALHNYLEQNNKPLLLQNINLNTLPKSNFTNLICSYNNEQLIPKKIETILKNALND